MKKTVLQVSALDAARKVRHLILHQYGYSVATTEDEGIALFLVAQNTFDVLVLCSSVPLTCAERVAAAARKGRRIPVVAFGPKHATVADIFVDERTSPEQWLELISKAVMGIFPRNPGHQETGYPQTGKQYAL